MAQQIINVGTLPNDGDGDPLRVAFQKTNNNFANLFSTAFQASTANTTGNTAGQVIFQTQINNFSQATFNIRSSDNNSNSQSIIINAQISNDNSNVEFATFGPTLIGNIICQYDMDVLSSNVRILCSPTGNANLTHRVFSQLFITS